MNLSFIFVKKLKTIKMNGSNKLRCFKSCAIIIALLLSITVVNAQKDSSRVKKIVENTHISGQWFLAFSQDVDASTNQFNLKRGYFTIKTDLSPKISVRYTQDITLDKEGSDAGNVEIRMKYLYMKYKPFSKGFLKDLWAEFGLVHTPWLDYEQKINKYRMQGKMYVEDIGMFGSADFGITVGGLIGGKLDKDIQKKIGKHYPGKYGSYSFGIYNGPGYHEYELNNNKAFEARLSIRPLPEFLPGFQISYTNAFGKTNYQKPGPGADFNLHMFYLSFEHPYITTSAQYYFGQGDPYGDFYLDRNPYDNDGYSFFGEFRIPKTSLGMVGRYDKFISHQTMDFEREAFFFGTSYRFLKNKVLLFYSREFEPGNNNDLLELVLEIAF